MIACLFDFHTWIQGQEKTANKKQENMEKVVNGSRLTCFWESRDF